MSVNVADNENKNIVFSSLTKKMTNHVNGQVFFLENTNENLGMSNKGIKKQAIRSQIHSSRFFELDFLCKEDSVLMNSHVSMAEQGFPILLVIGIGDPAMEIKGWSINDVMFCTLLYE